MSTPVTPTLYFIVFNMGSYIQEVSGIRKVLPVT